MLHVTPFAYLCASTPQPGVLRKLGQVVSFRVASGLRAGAL